jgi:hypothetical protein
MVVLFSMLDGEREVPCAISISAMDELEGVVRARAGEREIQFMRLRERIEICADGKYQASELEGAPAGIICAASETAIAESLCTPFDIHQTQSGPSH